MICMKKEFGVHGIHNIKEVNMCLLVCKSKPNEAFAAVLKHVSFILGLVLWSLPHFLTGCTEKS